MRTKSSTVQSLETITENGDPRDLPTPWTRYRTARAGGAAMSTALATLIEDYSAHLVLVGKAKRPIWKRWNKRRPGVEVVEHHAIDRAACRDYTGVNPHFGAGIATRAKPRRLSASTFRWPSYHPGGDPGGTCTTTTPNRAAMLNSSFRASRAWRAT